jgi:hypothetical protein
MTRQPFTTFTGRREVSRPALGYHHGMTPVVLSIWRGPILQRRTMRDIACEVAERFRVPLPAMLGCDCSGRVSAARHAAFKAMSDELGMSSAKIAEFFGNREPSTVRHVLRKRRLAEGMAAE